MKKVDFSISAIFTIYDNAMLVIIINCMFAKPEDKIPISFIRELCKNKTENEIESMEENFRELLLVIKGICDRLEDEGKEPIDYGH